MLSKPDALKALRAFFKKNRLAMLPAILTLLGTASRMTAHRRLRELDYLSSFSHMGRYYTLPCITSFDPHGLWFCQDVGFSRFGNLKETVIQLVDQSIAGKTHEELESQLRLRVHNALLDLVRSGKLAREAFEGVFVYISIRADRAGHQLARRHEGARDSVHDILPDGIVIEVLAEIIRASQV
ncbi:MAG: hypothetical protein GY833_15780, partial [Aestuariibacter sp.]|nr:hypothetical protein [Aestuariibacter sp.]